MGDRDGDTAGRVLELLESHIDDFRDHNEHVSSFIERSDEHFKRAQGAMTQVNELHGAIQLYVPNLIKLSSINSTLQNMEKAILRQNSELLTPATTAEKMPTKVTVLMLGALFAVIVFLGSALMLVLLRESNKEFRVGGENGVSITNPQEAGEKKPDNLRDSK